MESDSKVWMNGGLVSRREATVTAFDHGLLTGDGVFETLVAYDGRAFAVRRHYERLLRSAAVLELAVPPEQVLREAVAAVLEAGTEAALSRVRITLTGGEAPLGSEKGDSPCNCFVAAAPTGLWPPTADVVTVPFTRNESGALAGVKSTSYGENVAALAYAKKRGGSEAIFANTRGSLCEGTGSNVFFVRDGQLITPPLESGCLAGITRGLVLELAGDLGVDAVERDAPLRALAEAEEAFLTSTTREVQPIARVDGLLLGRVPGETGPRLADAFKELVARELDP